MSADNYTSNFQPQALVNVCAPPNENYDKADLMKIFKNGVANDNLLPDPSTGRIPVGMLQHHVESLEQAGVLKRRPTVKVGNGQETDMDALVKQDVELYERVHNEYCFYEQRYRYALKQFLVKATSRIQADNADAQAQLQNAKLLNLRVNSVLEVMNYLAQARVDLVNQNKTSINTTNQTINSKLDNLKSAYELLSRDDAIVRTQKASVMYTEEKNNYTTNQIGVWAALNVVALATIFYVYRA